MLIAPIDVILPRADEAGEMSDPVVQPNVLVVCDPAKIGEKRVRGAADLAIEVRLPATPAHELLSRERK